MDEENAADGDAAKKPGDAEMSGDTEWKIARLEGGLTEMLLIDPILGPVVYGVDGSTQFIVNSSAVPQWDDPAGPHQKRGGFDFSHKRWYMMTSTEQEVLCMMAARKNSKLRDWKGPLVAQIEKDLQYVGMWIYGGQAWEKYLIRKVAGAKLQVEGQLPSGHKVRGVLRAEERGDGLTTTLEQPGVAARFRAVSIVRLHFTAQGHLMVDIQEVSTGTWRRDVPLLRARRQVVVKMAESIAAVPASVAVGG
mmetsp:Transcript_38863/g.121434  ORF Transcript_38863/g.121434 Transcript_38863/m.121434 type:complete len:250 (+) Transcript_38863:64-813(+)|eukprot:CAMPEP_0204604644 /NCGR_PEP_ID=MMETSP0661-20131031/57997_1 /ASSEMBLY_ACC=CAM_ASM_000606 /TAXON_ID=109239 /ORGANISM="Alexandrium margalefi, Strain AMGDE01CS-322" /LENGTH=249 /DNA_ID=CAMNT_0051615823 /DNA_START=64 /DNA_END=813 /DNA_ORIENTATION=-